jgi:hypothetical protein
MRGSDMYEGIGLWNLGIDVGYPPCEKLRMRLEDLGLIWIKEWW